MYCIHESWHVCVVLFPTAESSCMGLTTYKVNLQQYPGTWWSISTEPYNFITSAHRTHLLYLNIKTMILLPWFKDRKGTVHELLQ